MPFFDAVSFVQFMVECVGLDIRKLHSGTARSGMPWKNHILCQQSNEPIKTQKMYTQVSVLHSLRDFQKILY